MCSTLIFENQNNPEYNRYAETQTGFSWRALLLQEFLVVYNNQMELMVAFFVYYVFLLVPMLIPAALTASLIAIISMALGWGYSDGFILIGYAVNFLIIRILFAVFYNRYSIWRLKKRGYSLIEVKSENPEKDINYYKAKYKLM